MASGVVRQVDRMGRIVVPKEFRNQLKIESDNDKVEIFLEGDRIVIKKFQPTCVFCHKLGPSADYAGYNVCKNCIEKLAAVVDDIK